MFRGRGLFGVCSCACVALGCVFTYPFLRQAITLHKDAKSNVFEEIRGQHDVSTAPSEVDQSISPANNFHVGSPSTTSSVPLEFEESRTQRDVAKSWLRRRPALRNGPDNNDDNPENNDASTALSTSLKFTERWQHVDQFTASANILPVGSPNNTSSMPLAAPSRRRKKCEKGPLLDGPNYNDDAKATMNRLGIERATDNRTLLGLLGWDRRRRSDSQWVYEGPSPLPGSCPYVREEPRDRFDISLEDSEQTLASCEVPSVRFSNSDIKDVNRSDLADTLLEDFQDKRFCRSECCSRCANRPGIRLQKFVEHLATKPKYIYVLTLGNSVARWGRYMTTRTFVETMSKHFPETKWHFQPDARGGTDWESIYNDMSIQAPESNERFKLVLLQWSAFGMMTKYDKEGQRNRTGGEALIRLLLELPQRPLVVFIQHCEFSAFADAKAVGGFQYRHWIYLLREQWTIVAHYGLPVVSMCSAIESIINPTCGEQEAFIGGNKTWRKRLSILQREFYNGGWDNTHYNLRGFGIAGCLLSDMLVSTMASFQRNKPCVARYHGAFDSVSGKLPKPVTSWMKTVFTYSTFKGTFLPALTVTNKKQPHWKHKQGGKDGTKKFLEASGVGATVLFHVPPCSHLALEFYKHHNLPMGRLEVKIDGRRTAIVDACCPAPGCPNIPIGQGFYYKQQVAENLPKEIHTVELTVLGRKKVNDTMCETRGAQFSIISMVGFEI